MRTDPIVAVYGGSFDPPHIGHELVACYVLGTYEVDRLIVIPVNAHAFGKPLSPFKHRFRMCQIAFSHLNRTHISDIEARIGGVSRTAATLKALAQEYPGTQLRLIVGSDLISSLPKWHGAKEILSLAPPIVVQRMGHITQPSHPCMPEVSSSDLRNELRAGKSPTGRLNPRVLNYISENSMYAPR